MTHGFSPDLGPGGEGWFAVQVVLLAAVGLAGGLGAILGGGLIGSAACSRFAA